MDPTYITPFIVSVQNVFSTMLNLPVEVKEPRIKTGSEAGLDVSSIIGMSGDVVGSVVLSFPTDTAKRLVSLFSGAEVSIESPDFADALGELVNMVSGGAKAMFEGKKVSISCPSVVVGSNHTIAKQKDLPTVVIPCETDCGEMLLQIAIQEAAVAASAKAA